MPSGRKKGQKRGAKPQTTQRSAKSIVGEASKSRIKSAKASTPLGGAKAGLKPRASTFLVASQDDPESILRNARKAERVRKAAQVEAPLESLLHSQAEYLAKSIETSFLWEHSATDSSSPYRYIDETPLLSEPNEDSEQTFYHNWGYLPPLDEEAAAIIDAIIADPSMASEYVRISPDKKEFADGLAYRNVSRTESTTPDQYENRARLLKNPKSPEETAEEEEAHGELWKMDRAKCDQGSNEALFQRTLMMNLIARHRLIYERDPLKERLLDFSVEEPWTCPPMPTRAYTRGERFLTQPKPDLAVCFRREALISELLWWDMPKATRRLACYEDIDERSSSRVFHFFTIEAKRATIGTDDIVAKCQSLNNASQALHNMFEFFRDAGPQHEKIFFEKVRFFSAVATTQGITIRVHRATRVPKDGSGPGLIMKDTPQYPLMFEHRTFCVIHKNDFDRKPVLELLERILFGYGANELRLMLQKAAKALVKKLSTDFRAMHERRNDFFYSYGQIPKPRKSRTQTPAASRGQSTQKYVPQCRSTMEPPTRAPSETNVSINQLRIGTTTPTQTQPTQSASGKTKRGRGNSEDTARTRNTRQRR